MKDIFRRPSGRSWGFPKFAVPYWGSQGSLSFVNPPIFQFSTQMVLGIFIKLTKPSFNLEPEMVFGIYSLN